MTATSQIHVGAEAAVLDDAGRLLICRQPKWDGWTFPGGHIEPGEKAAATAARETKEEAGIDIEVLDLLGVHECLDVGHYAHSIVFVFVAKIKPGQEVRPDGTEVTECRWVTMEQAESLLNKGYLPGLEQLKQWMEKK